MSDQMIVHHYCHVLYPDIKMQQCLLYDDNTPNARYTRLVAAIQKN